MGWLLRTSERRRGAALGSVWPAPLNISHVKRTCFPSLSVFNAQGTCAWAGQGSPIWGLSGGENWPLTLSLDKGELSVALPVTESDCGKGRDAAVHVA